MSKETLEELKTIVDTSPRGATNIDNYCDYIKVVGGDFYGWSDQLNEWGVFEYADSVTMRSLSDIKRIIELSEQLQELQTAYTEVLIHVTDSRMSKPYLDASVVKGVIDDVVKEKSEVLKAVLSEMAENANSNGYHDHAEGINEAIERLDEEGLLL